MLERLNTEQQLSRYAGWFIPLKIDSSSETWQEWASRYTHEGNTIPIVYVIRGDGEMLYGKSGSLPGDELYQLLNSSLNNAGVLLSEQQLASVEQAVGKAREYLEKDQTELAIKELGRLSKLGPIGEIGSYAAIVADANYMVKELEKKAQAIIEAAERKIEDEKTQFDAMLSVAECGDVYGKIPAVSREIKLLRSKWSRDSELKQVLKDVKQFARLLKQTSSGKTVKKLNAIRDFMNQNADQDSMIQRAVPILDRVVVKAFTAEPNAMVDWVSKSGHKIKGKLKASLADGKVTIETEDEKLKTIELEQLDEVSTAIAELQIE